MKKLLVLCLMSLGFVSCSGMKFTNIPSDEKFIEINKFAIGKEPKAVKDYIGQPLHAFYSKDMYGYFLYYPAANEEVTMTRAMFDRELGCRVFQFIKEPTGKYIYSPISPGMAPVPTNCTLNMDLVRVGPSLID